MALPAQVTYAVGSIVAHTTSWRVTSTATAGSTWPSPMWTLRHLGAAGQRRRHVPARGTTAWRGVHGLRRAISSVTEARPGPPDPAECRCSWATAMAPSSPRGLTRFDKLAGHGRADFNGDGGLDLGRPSTKSTLATGVVSMFLGNGDGTFQAGRLKRWGSVQVYRGG